jgi:hypothetical protein
MSTPLFDVRFIPYYGAEPRKVADAEIAFTAVAGLLAGVKIVGFGIYEKGDGFNVTMPARKYNLNGQSYAFALVRPAKDADGVDRLKAAIVTAYLAHELEVSR